MKLRHVVMIDLAAPRVVVIRQCGEDKIVAYFVHASGPVKKMRAFYRADRENSSDIALK